MAMTQILQYLTMKELIKKLVVSLFFCHGLNLKDKISIPKIIDINLIQ